MTGRSLSCHLQTAAERSSTTTLSFGSAPHTMVLSAKQAAAAAVAARPRQVVMAKDGVSPGQKAACLLHKLALRGMLMLVVLVAAAGRRAGLVLRGAKQGSRSSTGRTSCHAGLPHRGLNCMPKMCFKTLQRIVTQGLQSSTGRLPLAHCKSNLVVAVAGT